MTLSNVINILVPYKTGTVESRNWGYVHIFKEEIKPLKKRFFKKYEYFSEVIKQTRNLYSISIQICVKNAYFAYFMKIKNSKKALVK